MNMEYVEKFSLSSKEFVKETEAFVATLTPLGQKITVPCRSGDREAYFYRGQVGCQPAIFEIHGGCFSQGTAGNDDRMRHRMCAATGYHVIGLGYRKSPDHPYPCAVEDLFDQICYFVDHAVEYGIDVNRLGVWGHSAGGNLSCVMAWLGPQENRFRFRALLLDYPYVDTYTWGAEKSQELEGLTADELDAMNYIYAPRELRKEKWLSPVLACDEDIAQLPPTACVICGKDPLAIEDTLLVNRLLNVGVPVLAKKYPNMEHGFVELWFFREWYLKDTTPPMQMEADAEDALAFLANAAVLYLK